MCELPGPALVLGSTQPDADADAAAAAAAGVEVARRRSGGGAVLVVPGEVLWVDVVVPAGDPHWDDDVGRAGWFVGDAWAAALASLGVEAGVHKEAMVRTPWSGRVCFAGRGPGEVLLGGPGGPKVVGLSQRRTRAGAVIQCAALLRWDPAALLALLALEVGPRADGAAELAGVGAGLGEAGVTAAGLEAAFLAAIG